MMKIVLLKDNNHNGDTITVGDVVITIEEDEEKIILTIG